MAMTRLGVSSPVPFNVVEGVDEFEINFLSASAMLADHTLVDQWQRLVVAHEHPNVMYASPEWIAHLTILGDAKVWVWTVRNRTGRLAGVLPTVDCRYDLCFDVASRILCKIKLNVTEVLGSTPLIPDVATLHERLFKCIVNRREDCDAVYFDALPADGFCSKLLHDPSTQLGSICVYSPFGPRPWHLTSLYTSFDAFQQSMGSKTRSTLRRKVRRLEGAGELRITSCTQPEDVPEFLRQASHVSGRSWQQRLIGTRLCDDDESRAKFVDLAKRGLLRGYVLWSASLPCAFVLGYQFHGVYHYAELGFDRAYADYSPGTVLLFLILEDLHQHNPPKLLNFGVGDASYKRRFGTHENQDESLLLLRPSLRNRLSVQSHCAFNACLETTKALLGRRVRK